LRKVEIVGAQLTGSKAIVDITVESQHGLLGVVRRERQAPVGVAAEIQRCQRIGQIHQMGDIGRVKACATAESALPIARERPAACKLQRAAGFCNPAIWRATETSAWGFLPSNGCIALRWILPAVKILSLYFLEHP
jgi:hypothetical protein